jgi:3-phosphoglycerate kinase
MYDVALLIERQLTDLDADQVVALHEGLDDTVVYHLLLPVDTSASMLASSMSALGGGQIMTIADADMIADVQNELSTAGRAELDASAALLTARGQQVTASLTEDDPISALSDLVAETSSSEAIILTEPHIVREFLHVDWTSRAKRKLEVPTLHLLEHVPFSAQSP